MVLGTKEIISKIISPWVRGGWCSMSVYFVGSCVQPIGELLILCAISITLKGLDELTVHSHRTFVPTCRLSVLPGSNMHACFGCGGGWGM